MKTIWKYDVSLALLEPIELAIPSTGKLLDVQDCSGNKILWVELDTGHAINGPRLFKWYMTAESPPENSVYFKTLQWDDLVFHLYEVFSQKGADKIYDNTAIKK